uniref:Capsid protein n=1 Tax=Phoenicopteridae CRESS-DNA-virus sp. TaxID=2815051 RepID=A0A8A4XC54_9VIRU|nr:MAG: capsid protein [Phoenicopteridae CRESS-DNA-virus sp.]
MAYKRKRRTYRRKTYRRKTPRRYKRSFRRKGRNSPKLFHVKRAGQVSVVTTTATIDYTASGFFRLSDVFASTDFTGLFDHYRINCVVLKFIPDQGGHPDGSWSNRTPPVMYNPQFHWAIDYNDNNPVPTNQLVEYQSYKTRPFTRPITIKVFPRASQPIWISSISTGYASAARKTWIDTASANVGHYAIKFAVDNFNHPQSQIMNFKIRPIYYISFKGVK